MLPSSDLADLEVEREKDLPSKTWKIDWDKGRTDGMIEDRKAVEQASFLALSTERFGYLIYSDDYGFSFPKGLRPSFSAAVTPRRVEDALLQDDRITSVSAAVTEIDGNILTVKTDIKTVYGDVQVLKNTAL